MTGSVRITCRVCGLLQYYNHSRSYEQVSNIVNMHKHKMGKRHSIKVVRDA